MDLAAKHIGFVLASYAVAFSLLTVLVVLLVVRMRTVRRRLKTLEAQGTRRRAAASVAKPGAGGARREAAGDEVSAVARGTPVAQGSTEASSS